MIAPFSIGEGRPCRLRWPTSRHRGRLLLDAFSFHGLAANDTTDGSLHLSDDAVPGADMIASPCAICVAVA